MNIVLFILAGSIWLGGGQLVLASHYRRRGMPADLGLLIRVEYSKLNRKEWAILALLFLASFTIGAMACIMTDRPITDPRHSETSDPSASPRQSHRATHAGTFPFRSPLSSSPLLTIGLGWFSEGGPGMICGVGDVLGRPSYSSKQRLKHES
jgi:hypothetical protein